ncbi:hypothetical protein AYI68_g4486 [Smittium mucronatum]|uniref:Uncharacterized protein n=1 Tax=Smittium mucronatum TaxID=133383 RepID=A0A1R0GWY9_9FUNG|nr:hypothetical protein AYI68_g4486 [Smittium mucronatum]
MGNPDLCDRIFVRWYKLGYGMGNINPLNKIKFYSKCNKNVAFNLPENKLMFMPSSFEEVLLRVYTDDPKLSETIKTGFHSYLEKLD